MSLITALAPLGAKNSIAFVLAYSEDGASVTATITVKPKDGEKGQPRHLQIVGPLADAEAQVADQLPAAVGALVTHQGNLTTLAAQLAAEEKAEQDKAAAAKASKPAPVAAPAKPAPAAKKAPEKSTTPAAPAPAEATTNPPAAQFGVSAAALAGALAQVWLKAKTQAGADTIVLLRVGDFYEAFGDDAAVVAECLAITLTKRGDIPMAGVPFHIIEAQAEKLVTTYKLKVALVDGTKTTRLPATPIATPAPGQTAAEAALMAIQVDADGGVSL